MICFIVNPNSGSKSNRYRAGIVEKLQKIPNSQLYMTEYPGHARELIQKLIAENKVSRIIAVGGDGTVNEIGSSILGTKIAMGIIPVGSGNGLARHLGLPINFNQAMHRAVNGSEISIDTLMWNNRPFFCTAGIGFDAEVAHTFANGNGRGLLNYIRATFQTLRSFHTIRLSLGNDQPEELFSLTIANANQYGNNAYISPFSDVQDAQFEVVKIKKGNLWQLSKLGISLFLKNIHKHPLVRVSSTNTIEFRVPLGTAFHLDGESLRTTKEYIKINIHSKNLKIIV